MILYAILLDGQNRVNLFLPLDEQTGMLQFRTITANWVVSTKMIIKQKSKS